MERETLHASTRTAKGPDIFSEAGREIIQGFLLEVAAAGTQRAEAEKVRRETKSATL